VRKKKTNLQIAKQTRVQVWIDIGYLKKMERVHSWKWNSIAVGLLC
jgi:hypothetical protein